MKMYSANRIWKSGERSKEEKQISAVPLLVFIILFFILLYSIKVCVKPIFDWWMLVACETYIWVYCRSVIVLAAATTSDADDDDGNVEIG